MDILIYKKGHGPFYSEWNSNSKNIKDNYSRLQQKLTFVIVHYEQNIVIIN